MKSLLAFPWDVLSRFPIRVGRWMAWGRRLGLALLILLLAVGGMAAVRNRNIPPLTWERTPITPEGRALTTWGGMLYVVTQKGVVLRSANGENWQPAGNGLPQPGAVLSLVVDERDGLLYAGTREGEVFYSADGGEHWQPVAPPEPAEEPAPTATRAPLTASSPLPPPGEGPPRPALCSLPTLFTTAEGAGEVVRGPDGLPVWVVSGCGRFWARLAAALDLQTATVRPLPDGGAEIITVQGQTLARALATPSRPSSPAYVALRAVVWRYGARAATVLIAGLVLAVLWGIVLTYANLTRPFGLPLWAPWLAPRTLETYASPAALDAAWPEWERAVRRQLLRYGDVIPADLRHVPAPFRRYALRRYGETHDSTEALEVHPNRLRLLTGDRQRRWHTAWVAAGRSIGTRPGMSAGGRRAVDQLASVLAEALGLTLHRARDFEAVRALLVEAPALRLRLPPRFPLVFVADPHPNERTVQMLVDAVAVLRETGYFALVVPLEPTMAARRVDVAAELRQAVDRSPHVQDFIVLGRDDLLDILVARHPTQALVANILAQVDLTVVSPFVISGPVPETMFFGREAEVKLLVESAGSADFAIVGNRKIGKTSLLQRARARMAAGGRVRPLLVDCQIVRNARSFFSAFQAQSRLSLPEPTPEGVIAALTELHRQGPPPVLLMDEVDALLADEKTRGEPLVSTWRALAQAGICRFVFCGSTELARRLDDPDSAFFNFSQPLPLGYLAPETARLVLTQPLETLGIVLEEADRLLDEVLYLTSGHPNLIQYLGRGLVEAANRRGERRVLPEDLAALRDSTDFTEYYLKTVWGQAGTLERLITLLAPPDGFRIGELETALEAHGIAVDEEALDGALKLLRIYSILEKRGRIYTFIPRAFTEILHRSQEVERLIAIEKRRLG